jgi:hypothetical protein
VHPGQGTANRRFFFANAFLELLWIADEEEVRNGKRAHHAARAPERGDASPFGICFRPTPSSRRGTISLLTCPPG